MKQTIMTALYTASAAVFLILLLSAGQHWKANASARAAEEAQFDQSGPPPGGGPPGFGPQGFGRGFGGPGGPFGGEQKIVKKFDKNGDKWLNPEERKAAREFLKSEAGNRRQGFGMGGGRGGFRREQTTDAKPGKKISPTEVATYPEAPLYASNVIRTFFLEFENADWEKELADFKGTDVEVPAKLTVDGKIYPDVGVHFHGASSYMMVGEGQKRSMVLTMDFVHKDQTLKGYEKMNLLNSHEDSSFLRTVLAMQVARSYMPAPQANYVRVVINGESWGIYVNQQHFDKGFVKAAYGNAKGARWKVQGSPMGRAGLEYIGDDAEPYKRLYEIKSKDDAADWSALIKFCKVLNETPPEEIEAKLSPLLDIDSALKFLAWDVGLVNGDGFWTRASDYDIYMDEKGKFHIVPYDANETFSSGGGPGGRGGPPGFGGAGAPGRGGGMRFGPGQFFADQIVSQADKDEDGTVTKSEFLALSGTWYNKLAGSSGSDGIPREKFLEKMGEVLAAPQGFGPPGGPGQRPGQGAGGRGGFGPGQFMGPGLFTALDADKNGTVTAEEMQTAFTKWWTASQGSDKQLSEEKLAQTLGEAIPRPDFGGQQGGGRGGFRGPGGGMGPFAGNKGAETDPLVASKDNSKALASKLLAVPALRAKYLAYVKDIAENWLDWNKLGPIARGYHELIAKDIAEDTRKLDSTEEFNSGLESIKTFAEKRRAYLLNYKAPTP